MSRVAAGGWMRRGRHGARPLWPPLVHELLSMHQRDTYWVFVFSLQLERSAQFFLPLSVRCRGSGGW